jgi:HD-GYP domain-containing protein (c-di-GMP phosphodiesterase class II)
MTSDRPYRPALSRATAVGELIKGRGILFDPRVVDTFLGLLDARF